MLLRKAVKVVELSVGCPAGDGKFDVIHTTLLRCGRRGQAICLGKKLRFSADSIMIQLRSELTQTGETAEGSP
jgi:hypothetical protein